MKVLKKLGFLSALIFVVGLAFGVGNTSNASALAVQIRDNPDSPQMIQITRRVEGTTTTVRNNFTYSITQDANNPGTITGLPETITMPFWAAPDQYLIAQDSYFLEMDLAAFPALGDYKIIIRETASADAVNYPVDTAHEYYVYVSVRNKLDTNGQPTGEYTATLAAQARDHDTGDKVDILFLEGAHRSYAKLSKVVSGNLADKERYFKFKVTFDGLTDGDFFDVEGQDATVVYNGETITTSSQLVVGQDNYIYLKHGQSITIGEDSVNQIPTGLSYTIEEMEKTFLKIIEMCKDSLKIPILNRIRKIGVKLIHFFNYLNGVGLLRFFILIEKIFFRFFFSDFIKGEVLGLTLDRF